jgi:hypothetical protein
MLFSDGFAQTFGEMDAAQKGAISHRSLALRQLKAFFASEEFEATAAFAAGAPPTKATIGKSAHNRFKRKIKKIKKANEEAQQRMTMEGEEEAAE